jgi:carboxyl-terminal processing protease
MKITIQKFYLPNGDSTQNRGVVPDISLPSPNDYLRVGESDTPRAMPWDQIRAARFRSTDHVKPELVATLASLSKARVSSDPTFSLLNQEIQRLRQRMETGKISLNEQRRIQERETEDQRRKQWKALQADAVDYKKLPRYIVKQLVRGNPFVELSNLPEPIKREDEEAEEEEVSQNTSDIHLTETLQIAIDWLKGTSPQALVNTASLD